MTTWREPRRRRTEKKFVVVFVSALVLGLASFRVGSCLLFSFALFSAITPVDYAQDIILDISSTLARTAPTSVLASFAPISTTSKILNNDHGCLSR